jgi:TrmH family RNA methyltransferase
MRFSQQEMITSPQNKKIKWVRSLQSDSRARRESRACVVEGVRMAEEVISCGIRPLLVLHTSELTSRAESALDTLAGAGTEIEAVSPRIMLAASDTQTPQGLLLVLPIQPPTLAEELSFILILDGVRDPGNLGTILRTAAAAGTEAVFITPGSADPYAPKVLRAGMGAHFRLHVACLDWAEIMKKTARLKPVLASPHAGKPYYRLNLAVPLALIIGGEADGAGSQARNYAYERVHIPMAGEMESLNAAAAAAVLIFEVIRQRGSKSQKK